MRIFKNTRFARFADKEGISDSELREAASLLDAGQFDAGQFDADLGGGVYKMRLARPSAGKSGGYRVIVAFRRGHRTFYVEGFAKSQRANIGQREKKDLKVLAKDYLDLPDEVIDRTVRAGRLVEI